MIVGDSLTAGFGLKQDQSYPSILEGSFQAEKIPVKVINGGVSGDTTAGGLRRLDWMLNRTAPDLLVVALGGNDMLRGLPVEQTKKNLEAMITTAKERSIPVVLLGVPAAPNLGRDYENKFNAMFRSLAQEKSIPVLPNYIEKVAGDPKLNLPDGIHPNFEGQKMISEELYAFLKPLVVQYKAKERK